MKGKKLVSLFLALCLLFALAACGNGAANNGGDAGGEAIAEEAQKSFNTKYLNPDSSRTLSSDSNRYDSVRIALPSAANNLQPYSSRDAGINPIIANVYETLFDQYGLDDFRPRVGKEYKVVDDLHLEVTLFDNVKDTAGNGIKASDVKFSYELLLDSGFATGDLVTYYKDIEAVDDTTVRFTWNEPVNSLTAYGNILCTVYLVSEKSYNSRDFANDPVGSGPYKIQKYVTGAYCIIEANDDYWQTDVSLKAERAGQNVNTIRFDVVADGSMRLIALENGTASYCALDDETMVDFVEGGKYDGQYQLVTIANTQNQYVVPNLSPESPMSDINLRLAVYYAIDVDAMAYAMGEATYQVCSVDASRAYLDYQPEWDNEQDNYYFKYDPELAKEYLKKSSYKGEDLVVLTGTFEVKKKQAEIIVNYLNAIGITCHMDARENAVLQQVLPDMSAWDINIGSQISDSTVAEKLYREFHSAYGNRLPEHYNYAFLTGSELDTLEAMLTEIMSPEGYSAENIKKVMDYVTENAYSYGTMYTVSYIAYDLSYAQLVYNYGSTIVPGACIYYLD